MFLRSKAYIVNVWSVEELRVPNATVLMRNYRLPNNCQSFLQQRRVLQACEWLQRCSRPVEFVTLRNTQVSQGGEISVAFWIHVPSLHVGEKEEEYQKNINTIICPHPTLYEGGGEHGTRQPRRGWWWSTVTWINP